MFLCEFDQKTNTKHGAIHATRIFNELLSILR